MPVATSRLLGHRPGRYLRSRTGEILGHEHHPGSCESTISILMEGGAKRPNTFAAAETDNHTTTFCRNRLVKRVSFSSIDIRLYEVEIGDHPCCHTGCPLTLGWQYHQERTYTSIEDYEATRVGRRFVRTTTCDERHHRLLQSQTCSSSEIRRASRIQQRHRDRRLQRAEQRVFFQGQRNVADV